MTTEQNDNELVQECLAGDEHAFEILLLRYQGPVFNAILRMVRHRDEASDLTQTAFLKAYEQLGKFDSQHKFFSYADGSSPSTGSGRPRRAVPRTLWSARISASTSRML
jgi:hypothetical protein